MQSSEPGIVRPAGSIRNDMVNNLFDTMLGSILTSWKTISQKKEDIPMNYTHTTESELNIKKTKHVETTSARPKPVSQIQVDPIHPPQDPLHIVWWSAPDETVKIYFKNGNKYEGQISNKVMHGEGCFYWADGTIYTGHFKDNKITGRGQIQWKNDSWYEGEFKNNIRHGKGLFVDSRHQRSYSGDWDTGTKHGNGLIKYSKDLNDFYDGDWVENVRHGFGCREYSKFSGYRGEWELYVKDGKGFMIWPSGDFYSGDWINGSLSGFGVYMWDSHWNGSLSMSPINGYYGNWLKGNRHGSGVLKLGSPHGSYYQGGFKNNLKHGSGELVDNSGNIFLHNNLFENDNLQVFCSPYAKSERTRCVNLAEDCNLEMCTDILNIDYHAEKAIERINKIQISAHIIDNYLKDNNLQREKLVKETGAQEMEDIVNFEILQLRRAIKNHIGFLQNIYNTYATICNTEKVDFDPVLIRLYLWQFLFDCNIHQKGFTLVEIDRMFHGNPQWLSKRPHNPFEVIYFWQFLHILISLACSMYAEWEVSHPKPETVLAKAFNTFMETDAVMACGSRKGELTGKILSEVPLKRLYYVYRSIGEPHTIRDFLNEVRHPPHLIDIPLPELIDTPEEQVPQGRNVVILADKIIFIEDLITLKEEDLEADMAEDTRPENLKLFNFCNLASETILKKFGEIFPNVYNDSANINTEVEITFFEFLQVFIACAKESVIVAEDEVHWRNKLPPK